MYQNDKKWMLRSLFLCLVMTVAVGFVSIKSSRSYVDDYQSQFLPVYTEIGRALDAGEYPLLSPYSWVGGVLGGEYQYGVFNIPHLSILYTLYKLHLTPKLFANALTLVYFFILCLGISVLARMYEMSFASEMLAVSIGSLNYFVLGWCGFDWIAGFTSFAWLPWCWAAFKKQLAARKILYMLPAGVAVYLLLTLGYPFTVGMLALVTVWLCAVAVFRERRLGAIGHLGAAWALGLGLSMPALLMLIQYSMHAVRLSGTEHVNTIWSVPADAFWGVFTPSYRTVWKQWKGYTYYFSFEVFCGAAVPVVLLALAFHRTLRRKLGIGPELLLLLVVVAIMIAPSSTASYRWSFRWLPLYGLVLAVIAGKGVEAFGLTEHAFHTFKIFGYRVCAAICCGFISLAIFVPQHVLTPYTAATQIQKFYFLYICAGYFLWAYFLRRKTKYRRILPFIPVFITFSVLYLLYVLPVTYRTVIKWHALNDFRTNTIFKPDIRYLGLYTERDFYSWFSPTIIMPGNTPMLARVHFVNGYSPMMLEKEYALFRFAYASTVEPDELASVFTNGFAKGGLFDLLGIDGVVLGKRAMSNRELWPRSGWTVVHSGVDCAVLQRDGAPSPLVESVSSVRYGNSAAAIVSYLHGGDGEMRGHILEREKTEAGPAATTFAPVSLGAVKQTRNALSVAVSNTSPAAPGLVVIRRAWYPGYRAFLDATELPIRHADMLLPAVEIPPGQRGTLRLVYDPVSLRIGSLVAAASVLFAVAMLAAVKWKALSSRKASLS